MQSNRQITFFRGSALGARRHLFNPETTRADADLLERALDRNARSQLLNILYGNGRHSIELAGPGYGMTGLDKSEKFIAQGPRRQASRDSLAEGRLRFDSLVFRVRRRQWDAAPDPRDSSRLRWNGCFKWRALSRRRGRRRDAPLAPRKWQKRQGAAEPAAPNSKPRPRRALAYFEQKMALTMGSSTGDQNDASYTFNGNGMPDDGRFRGQEGGSSDERNLWQVILHCERRVPFVGRERPEPL